MLQSVKLSNVLVIDIETVSQHESFHELDPEWQELWSRKAASMGKEDMKAADIYDRAAIYAEFGKIICISSGIFVPHENGYNFRVKSFYGHDEKQLLSDFAYLLHNHFNTDKHLLAAHNGKEFDFPYLCRRMLINKLTIPHILDIAGKKPWEVQHIDTMELWKFGDHKNYTSLNLIAKSLGIASPKDDIDGSMVGHTYWVDKDLNRIVNYCQKDIITTARVLQCYKGEKIIEDNEVSFV